MNQLSFDPIDNPTIKVESLPKHNPDRFETFKELKNDKNNVVGFELTDGKQFFYDRNGGWKEENGCYYNKDGEPDGWYVNDPIKKKGDKQYQHYFDQFGQYLPTDEDDISESSVSESEDENLKFEEEVNIPLPANAVELYVKSHILDVSNTKLLKELKVEIAKALEYPIEDFKITAFGTNQEDVKLVHVKLLKLEEIGQIRDKIANLNVQVRLWDSDVTLSGTKL